MQPFVVFAALASDGFIDVRTSDGCVIAMRPEDHPDKSALRATCHWPDVAPESVEALVADYRRYSEFIGPIVASEIRGTHAAGTLVYQRQHIWPIADREVLLWMTASRSDGLRVAWTAAHEVQLTLLDGSVRVPRSDGFWWVRGHPDGGAWVVHQIAMDGGGSIPRWLVELVRTKGFAQVTERVRAIARGG